MYCTLLYCTALYCTGLHFIALHCITLHCIVLHCIAAVQVVLSWDSPLTWVVTALLLDLGYYVFHRASHEVWQS